jgi:hypothetical protein
MDDGVNDVSIRTMRKWSGRERVPRLEKDASQPVGRWKSAMGRSIVASVNSGPTSIGRNERLT